LRPVLRTFLSARYRLGQFRRALSGGVPQGALERALPVLPPQARDLFLRQARHDQRHALAVYDSLVAEGHTAAELLQAALLHDVGKTAGGVPLLARGLIVMLRRLAPQVAFRLGQGQPQGWCRPFVVLAAHPDEGARLAAEAGCPPLAASLIRRHEETMARVQNYEDRLLAALQDADAKS